MKELTDQSTPKQESIQKLNELTQTIQGVYYDLENFSEHDAGGSSLTKAIALMDEMNNIRNKILQRGHETNEKTE